MLFTLLHFPKGFWSCQIHINLRALTTFCIALESKISVRDYLGSVLPELGDFPINSRKGSRTPASS
jgi:hypothetical protein